jgi:hypothetical protein
MAAKIAALLHINKFIKNNYCERRRYCPYPDDETVLGPESQAS